MAMSPSARGRLGQLTRQVREGGRAMIAPAQAGLERAYLQRAEDLANEAGEVLTDEERARRAGLLRRMDMIRRAEKARAARNRNRAARAAGLRRRLEALERAE